MAAKIQSTLLGLKVCVTLCMSVSKFYLRDLRYLRDVINHAYFEHNMHRLQ